MRHKEKRQNNLFTGREIHWWSNFSPVRKPPIYILTKYPTYQNISSKALTYQNIQQQLLQDFNCKTPIHINMSFSSAVCFRSRQQSFRYSRCSRSHSFFTIFSIPTLILWLKYWKNLQKSNNFIKLWFKNIGSKKNMWSFYIKSHLLDHT